jgi:peptide/nickel transport system substrate-binding protein
VEILDDYHIRVHLKDPWGEWLKVSGYYAYGIVSPSAALKHGDEGFTYNEGGNVGTGPLKFLYWVPEEEAVYERWDDYVGTQSMPKYDRLVIKFFRDAATLRLAIEEGSVDIAFHFIGEADVPDLMENPDLGYVRFPHPSVEMVMMSMHPRWNYTANPLVREAIAYCINYDALTELFDAERAYGLINKNVWPEYNLELQNQFYYNPEHAKELLALAGYPDGLPEPLDFWYDPRGWGATEEASIIIEGLNAAGIEVDVKTSDVLVKNWLDRIVLMAPHGHTTTVGAVSYVMDANYRSSTLNAFRSSFNNSEVDALLDEARATSDEELRMELYHQIQRIADPVPSHQIYCYRGWDTAFYRKDTMKPIPLGPFNGALTMITTDVLLWEPVD